MGNAWVSATQRSISILTGRGLHVPWSGLRPLAGALPLTPPQSSLGVNLEWTWQSWSTLLPAEGALSIPDCKIGMADWVDESGSWLRQDSEAAMLQSLVGGPCWAPEFSAYCWLVTHLCVTHFSLRDNKSESPPRVIECESLGSCMRMGLALPERCS